MSALEIVLRIFFLLCAVVAIVYVNRKLLTAWRTRKTEKYVPQIVRRKRNHEGANINTQFMQEAHKKNGFTAKERKGRNGHGLY